MKTEIKGKTDLPREKMKRTGIRSLEDEELLALMLDTGTKEESVFDLSRRLVKEYGFSKLFQMEYKDIIKIKGIKDAKASKLLAAFEITRRIIRDEASEIKLMDSKTVFQYAYPDFYLLDYELLEVLYVDIRLHVISKDKFTDKKPDEIAIPMKDIILKAANLKAYGIFILHNHPQGTLYPSESDLESTRELIKLLKTLEIHFFDHLILSNGMYFSFSDSDILMEPQGILK